MVLPILVQPFMSFAFASHSNQPRISVSQFNSPLLSTCNTRYNLFSLSIVASVPDPEPSDSASRFGRQEYWDQFYHEESGSSFSWYTGWKDVAPFLVELLKKDDKILLPGVGNDAMLLDMYEAGYQQLTAFDYAPEGIKRCQKMLGNERINSGNDNNIINNGVTLFVGDARDLPQLNDASFDIVLEKGTLDAIIQSGGGIEKEQKALGHHNMEKAITELSRLIKPGGTFISVSAICTEALENSPQWQQITQEYGEVWEMIRDGSTYFTDDGYASNNFDGTLLAWRKKS